MHGRSKHGVRLIRRRLSTIAAAAALAVAGVASAADSLANRVAELPLDLAQTVNEYDRATTSNDIETLDDIVADDYMLVNSDSSVQDKQSYLHDFTVPGFELDPYVLEQPVQKVWGDAAVTGGLLRLSWMLDGEHESRLLRIAHVWARRDGQWLLTYTQLTRVAIGAKLDSSRLGNLAPPSDELQFPCRR